MHPMEGKRYSEELNTQSDIQLLFRPMCFTLTKMSRSVVLNNNDKQLEPTFGLLMTA